MKQSKESWLIRLLLLITITAVAVAIWALFFRKSNMLPPDYAPQEEESLAERIPSDRGQKLEAPEGGGAVRLSYSDQISIDLSEEMATLLFANPGSSGQDLVLQVVVQESVIIQSGRLVPGKRVTKLELQPGIRKRLEPGGYDGKFVVSYYHEETGEKAILSTEIPIKATVRE